MVLLALLVVLLAGCGGAAKPLLVAHPPVAKVNGNQGACLALTPYFNYNPGNVSQTEISNHEQALATQLKKYDGPNTTNPKLRADIPNLINNAGNVSGDYQKFQSALTAMVETCANLGYPLSAQASGSAP